jgi:hypothetical protein
LAAAGAGEAIRAINRFVVIFNSNEGKFSTDILNRSINIHLDPRGDLDDRRPSIGDPKLEFLPANQRRIEAELNGIVERWKSEGCPLDQDAIHPMKPCVRVIGGILKASGFSGFLENRRLRGTVDDDMRAALAELGAARPGIALRPIDWARIAVSQGLVKRLLPSSERDTVKGRERSIGKVLSKFLDQTFIAPTESQTLRLKLKGGFRRWTPGRNPHTRYIFELLESTPVVTADEDSP